jgi:hypothetical protein
MIKLNNLQELINRSIQVCGLAALLAVGGCGNQKPTSETNHNTGWKPRDTWDHSYVIGYKSGQDRMLITVPVTLTEALELNKLSLEEKNDILLRYVVDRYAEFVPDPNGCYKVGDSIKVKE